MKLKSVMEVNERWPTVITQIMVNLVVVVYNIVIGLSQPIRMFISVQVIL